MRLFLFTLQLRYSLCHTYTLLKMLRHPKEPVLTKVLSAGIRSPENKILKWIQSREKAGQCIFTKLWVCYSLLYYLFFHLLIKSLTYMFIHSFFFSSIFIEYFWYPYCALNTKIGGSDLGININIKSAFMKIISH